MAEKKKDPARVLLKDVRLSFGDALFKAKTVGDEGGEPKFSSSFLMDPTTKIGKANIALCEDAIEHVRDAKWADKQPKIPAAKIALRDGNEKEYDGYEDMMYVSASNSKPPKVLDRDKTEIVEADGIVYSGCYVDAIVRFWAQDNKYGKRVNASLEAVRFRRDGDAFGAAPVDPDEFDDLDDEDEKPSRSRRSRDDDEDEKPSRSRRSRDEDEDEKPARRRRAAEDDEEEEKPARRRRPVDEDDEEEEERPARRRRA